MRFVATAVVSVSLVTLLGCPQVEDGGRVMPSAEYLSGQPNNSDKTTEEIRSKVRTIIAEQFGVAEDSFSLSDPLMSKLGADELDVVELVMEIEDQFQIAIPDEVWRASVSCMERSIRRGLAETWFCIGRKRPQETRKGTSRGRRTDAVCPFSYRTFSCFLWPL